MHTRFYCPTTSEKRMTTLTSWLLVLNHSILRTYMHSVVKDFIYYRRYIQKHVRCHKIQSPSPRRKVSIHMLRDSLTILVAVNSGHECK